MLNDSTATRTLLLLAITLVAFPGCRAFRSVTATSEPIGIQQGSPLNPLPVPMLQRELVMDEVSDTIDDYFPILKEERIRNVNGVLSEGWIETRPKIGGQLFEPWKRDSTPGFEKLHATLQTIRRFAKIRVIPTANNYLIDLKVYKELEDLQQPIGSTVSGRPLRVDNALDIDRNEIFEVVSQGWIPLGRDISLEQEILGHISQRFIEAANQSNAASGNSDGTNGGSCAGQNCDQPNADTFSGPFQ